MALNIDPASIAEALAQERRELDAFGRARGGRPRHRDGGRRGPRAGAAARHGERAARVPRRRLRTRLQPGRRRDRLHHPGRVRQDRRGRPGQADRHDPVRCPWATGSSGRVVDALGRPLDDKGPIAVHRTPQPRGPGAERRLAPAGEGAALHGHLGHRRHDRHRARPAAAHHRRPADRQDRGRRRRHHRPARALGHRPRREVHLRRHRPEGLHRVRGRRDAARERRARVHGRRERVGLGPGAVPVHRALRGRGARRLLDVRGRQRAHRLRRPVQAGRRLPRDLAAAPPPAGPRGLPRRRLLPALPPAGARREALRRAGRRLA